MTAPTFAPVVGPITRSADHRYTDKATGITVPGVTGILDIIDKSYPMMTYAAKQTAEAMLAMLPKEIPESMYSADIPLLRLLDAVGPEGVKKAVTSRSAWQRDEAAQLGTEVHDLADKLVRGIPPPDTMTDTQRKRVEHYAKWWESELQSGSTLRLSEAMVLRPADDITGYGWGGTFDLLYRDPDGCTVLADIKTGGKWGRKAYESEILQVTAYGLAKYVQPAVENLLTDTPQIFLMPLPDKYKLIHVTGEGCKPIDVDVTTRERMAWLAALELYNWREGLKGKIR